MNYVEAMKQMVEALSQLASVAIGTDHGREFAHQVDLAVDAMRAGRQAIAEAEKQTLSPRINDARVHAEHDRQREEARKLIGEKQEPVAWIDEDILEKMDFDRRIDIAKIWSTSLKDRQILDTDKPLYTSPPASVNEAPQHQPLDMFETEKLAKQCGVEWTQNVHKLCNLSAHGIKEKA